MSEIRITGPADGEVALSGPVMVRRYATEPAGAGPG